MAILKWNRPCVLELSGIRLAPGVNAHVDDELWRAVKTQKHAQDFLRHKSLEDLSGLPTNAKPGQEPAPFVGLAGLNVPQSQKLIREMVDVLGLRKIAEEDPRAQVRAAAEARLAAVEKLAKPEPKAGATDDEAGADGAEE